MKKAYMPKWNYSCGNHDCCDSEYDYGCGSKDHDKYCHMPKMKCTKECVKTYKCYYKLYKICYYRLYKVCPHCGHEYDYYDCRGMCPRCC